MFALLPEWAERLLGLRRPRSVIGGENLAKYAESVAPVLV
jgi:hypothetical protein